MHSFSLRDDSISLTALSAVLVSVTVSTIQYYTMALILIIIIIIRMCLLTKLYNITMHMIPMQQALLLFSFHVPSTQMRMRN